MIVCFALLWAGSAFAQSTAELQAIGQVAAAKYGVPWNLFQAQIQGESGWNPNIGCNSSGACGIAQFIPGTAAQFGVNTGDATSSLNGAAAYDAQLFQQTGSWSAALTKYTGGLTPSNPGNESYATAFADAIQADAGNIPPVSGTPLATSGGTAIIPGAPGATVDPASLGLGGSGLVLGDGSILNGTPAAVAPVQDPPTFRPFSWLWAQWQNTVQQPMQQDTAMVTQKAGGIVGVLAMIALAATAIAVAYRIKDEGALVRKFFKAMAVVATVGAGGLYQPMFVDLVNSIPGWLGQDLNLNGGAAGPAGAFDNLGTMFLVSATAIMKGAPYLSGEMFLDIFYIFIAGILFAVPLVVMFSIWFCAQVTAQILLVIGGLLFLTLLSGYTEQIFFNYLHAFIGLAVVAFLAIIISLLSLQMMQGLFNGLPHASATTSASNLVLGGLAIAAIATILAIIWRTVERITGSAGHAQMAHTAQNIIQNTVIRTAGAAGGVVAGSAAGAASNITQFRRSSGPVGRSVSGG